MGEALVFARHILVITRDVPVIVDDQFLVAGDVVVIEDD